MELIRKQEGRAVILCHQNADPDCLCSALALREGIRKINPSLEVDVGAAESFSSASYRILEEYEGATAVTVNPSLNSELVIVLDTSSWELLSPLDEELRNYRGKLMVIDHHVPNQLQPLAEETLIDPAATSTSELVYSFLKDLGVDVNGAIARNILIGILSDTRCLRFASTKAVKIVCFLLDRAGVSYDEAVSIIVDSEEPGERIARLKAAQRMVIHKVGDYILTTSEVGSFAGSSASALVALGADCAFVGGMENEEIRVSARASKGFMNSTNIHLGRDVMSKIGKCMEGSGGGLRGAAGARGRRGGLSEVLDECVSIVKTLLKDEGK